MQQVPEMVIAYLASRDGLVRAQLSQTHPNLEQILHSAQTRTAILNWLGSEAAWDPSVSGLVANSLEFIRTGASESEVQFVRPFLLHPDPNVRVHAYEFLLTLFFPDRNREAMFILLHNMLSDSDDMVRTQAAHYVEGANATAELKPFLERWYQSAQRLGWNGTASHEMIGRLLNQ